MFCSTACFRFRKTHGANATHLVWAIGFQNRHPDRKSALGRSLADQSRVRKRQRRISGPETCRSHFTVTRTFRSRRQRGGDREKNWSEARGELRFVGSSDERARLSKQTSRQRYNRTHRWAADI